MTNMNAVFLETSHDAFTKFVHRGRRGVYTAMPAAPLYELFREEAVPANVIATHTSAGGFDLFSASGHGTPKKFQGQSSDNIYDIWDTHGANYTVRGAIVHLYACECGENLGPSLVRYEGARAFIGYVEDVAMSGTYAVEEQFVRVPAAIDRSILNGDNWVETKRKADAEAVLVVAALKALLGTDDAPEIAAFEATHAALVGPWTDTARFGTY
jgi:hypothetical protein